jgi:hypothetical protein
LTLAFFTIATSDLSGADHRHEEAAWLPEAAREDGGLGSEKSIPTYSVG